MIMFINIVCAVVSIIFGIVIVSLVIDNFFEGEE